MPPKKKFSKDQIIEKAFEIARVEGIEAITARRIANVLECSVAPIYVNFKDIEDLKKAVVSKIFEISKSFSDVKYTGDKFLDIGIASLRFAKEYSVFFRDLLLNKNSYMNDYDEKMGNDIVDFISEEKDLKVFSKDELNIIFLKMRIFQLGLSTMVANELLPESFGENEQIELLKSVGEDVINLALLRKKEDNGGKI